MNPQSISRKNLDYHGFVAGFCRDMGVAKLIGCVIARTTNIQQSKLLVTKHVPLNSRTNMLKQQG